MDTKDALFQQDTDNMITIMVYLACIMPVYYGFKKSPLHGLINSGAVGAVLYCYFTFPVAQTIIAVLFIVYILVGVIGSAIKNVF